MYPRCCTNRYNSHSCQRKTLTHYLHFKKSNKPQYQLSDFEQDTFNSNEKEMKEKQYQQDFPIQNLQTASSSTTYSNKRSARLGTIPKALRTITCHVNTKRMNKRFLSASYVPLCEMLLPLLPCHACRVVARLVNRQVRKKQELAKGTSQMGYY